MDSNRLAELINNRIMELGKNGKAKLAVEAEVSVATLDNIRSGGLPKAGTAYRIAMACLCKHEEAHAVARECSSDGSKETA